MLLDKGKLKVTSKYGKRTYTYQGKKVSDFHRGLDVVPIPYIGNEKVLAFEDGVVHSVRKTGKQYGDGCYVRLRHVNGYHTYYLHLKTSTITVDVGDKVKKGDVLGVIGKTGQATGVHLHFQIDKGSGSSSIDPYPYVFEGKEFPKAEKPKLKSNEEIAKEVWAGKWGNDPERKKRLIEAGYDRDAIQKLVNSMSKPKDDIIFKVGDKVYPIKKISYDGKPLRVWDRSYHITDIKGDRVVLAARRGRRLVVWAAVNINNIRKV